MEKDRKNFFKIIAKLELTHIERAVALLWYYRDKQEFDDRTVTELADDLNDNGFPKPNVTDLFKKLLKSKYVVKGKRKKSFQIDARRVEELNNKYYPLLNIKEYSPSNVILPDSLILGTRGYLEKIAYQINVSYDLELYDSCSVMMRRLLESLIIEIYISLKRQNEIKTDKVFLNLENLINFINKDSNINLGRNTYKTMCNVKFLGDTAAHDRTYITQLLDIDEIKKQYRVVITELLSLAKIKK